MMRLPPELHPLAIRIRATLRGIPPGPVWIACSGGLDSGVLAAVAVPEIQADGRDAGLLYIDHGQHERSQEAAEAVKSLAVRLGAESEVCTIGPPREASEALLRQLRYSAFRRVARRRGLRAVLLGHHRDDQIETVLFRLRRGAGPHGLAGIPRSHSLCTDCETVRPFLDVPRSELERAAGLLDLSIVEDPTNEDLRFARNRLRHVDLPRLREIHTSFDERLLALAAKRRQRNESMTAARLALEPQVLQRDPGRVWIDGASLRGELPALREELLFVVAWQQAGGPLESRLVRRLDALLQAKPGTRLADRGGLLGERRGEDLLLTNERELGAAPNAEQTLEPGATARFGTTGWVVRNRTADPLTLRARRTGGEPLAPGLRRRLSSLAGRLDRERVPLRISRDGTPRDVLSCPNEIEILERPALYLGDRVPSS